MASIKDTVIVWDDNGEIKVQLVGYYNSVPRTYQSSWGACNREVWEAKNKKELQRLLFINIFHISLFSNIHSKKIHDALLKIDEYRATLNKSELT